jgi:hypothetical protein
MPLAVREVTMMATTSRRLSPRLNMEEAAMTTAIIMIPPIPLIPLILTTPTTPTMPTRPR